MTATRRKRLIEVAFPLEEVSEDARKDPYRGSPHPQTLHRWWARRPLSACRAFIYASLVDDPDSDVEREELLKEVADLAGWAAVRRPDSVVRPKTEGGSGLTGTELLERARRRILQCNGGKPPKLLDPFAGGGAIPLEALRLGCEVEASDLNPVATLILKGTVEYPQKYGQPNCRQVPEYIHQAANDPSQGRFNDGDLSDAYRRNPLVTDVRYWSHRMLEKAREKLAGLYPSDSDGCVPVTYLWSRTIPCPSCHAEMPLIRQYWLARNDKKKVALQPVVDRENQRVDFKVVEGPQVTGNPGEATTSRGDTRCLLCGQVVKAAQVHEAGRKGQLSARPTAVVTSKIGARGKSYREPTREDARVVSVAEQQLSEILDSEYAGVSLIPDEPLAYHPQYMLVREYGLDQWGKLFNTRQLLTLTTFAKLVKDTHVEMLRVGMDAEYAKAVTTYLGISTSRLASEHSTLARWNPSGQKAQGALGLQALPMVWDFAELNPWGGSVGDANTAAELASSVIEFSSGGAFSSPAQVFSRDARLPSSGGFSAIVTDPPYYDSINYSDISDFFYVWLKRSVGFLYTDMFSLPLTPKREQIVMNTYATHSMGSVGESNKEEARRRYVEGMTEAFGSMSNSLMDSGVQGVVFAHTDPDAWATLIEGLIETGLVPDASWPIDTEIGTKLSATTQARLKTSVWMACRKREKAAGEAFLGDVLAEMRPVIRERLLYFWSKGIRGADFFISAIGPALSVFGRAERVLRPDGTTVTVRDFLDIVRRESTDVALEQVLHGADLGVMDPVTRQYVTWVWSYSRAPLDAGEAIALCLATGATYADTTRPASIAVEGREKSKKVVRLRTIRQRTTDSDLGFGTSARPAPLIDQLQYAAWLWGQNRTADLGSYRGSLGETRWEAIRTLGQAVAECLPDGDEDRRIINGLLGSGVMAVAPPANGADGAAQPAGSRLPGFETEDGNGTE